MLEPRDKAAPTGTRAERASWALGRGHTPPKRFTEASFCCSTTALIALDNTSTCPNFIPAISQGNGTRTYKLKLNSRNPRGTRYLLVESVKCI